MKKVLRSKYIYTAKNEKLIDGYVIIEGNKIVKVIEKENIQLISNNNIEIFDFTNEFIMPGFHDFHVHLIIGAMMEHDGILRYANTEEEAAEMLWAKNKNKLNGEWILGGAWDHFRWPNAKLPVKSTLDKFFPNNPVLLLNKECHGAWANSKTFELFKITKTTKDPENGGFERLGNGEPAGYIHEQAMIPMFQNIIGEMSNDTLSKFTKSFMEKANKLGITSVSDLPIYGIIRENTYDILQKNGELTVRINFSKSMMENIGHLQYCKNNYYKDSLRFIGTKDFIDGTPMGHSGYMIESYADRNNYRSQPMIAPNVLNDKVCILDENEIKVRLHACGDAAVRMGLDAFQEAVEKNGKKQLRHCIEHIESIALKDIARFGELDVVASVQPEHLPKYDFYHHPFHTIIGQERMKYSWPFKTLKDNGANLAFGTDYPVSELSPFMGIYRAVNRKTNEDEPENGFNEWEKLSMHDTLQAYTLGSAYAANMEHKLGTLEEGKLADIVVLNVNLFECANDREKIFSTEVLMTIVDGNVVYEK